ncbi:hypothetical protein ACT6QH_01300 [Xanthobacter sp. TB0139]|uniref:hypothetical protein n=1 Tax=Xanthobacter sp. TB0139 TaxID=3459178 RepID=UPI004039F446
MAGSNIVSLFRTRPANRDWNNQELAEFYRVESALLSVGFRVDTDRGLTDEGEPWFIFADANSGDVIVHCARTDGAYLIASAAFDHVLRGPDFRTLVETFLERNPLVLPPADTPEKKSNVRLHPSALLVALIATAFFKLSATDAEAAEHDDADANGALTDPLENPTQEGAEMDRRQSLVVLAAVAVVTSQLHGDMDRDIASSHTSILPSEEDNAADADFAAMLASSGLTRDSAQRADDMSQVIASGFQEAPQEGHTASQGSIDRTVGNILDGDILFPAEQTLDLDFTQVTSAHPAPEQAIDHLASSLQSDGPFNLSALFAADTAKAANNSLKTASTARDADASDVEAAGSAPHAEQSAKLLVESGLELEFSSSATDNLPPLTPVKPAEEEADTPDVVDIPVETPDDSTALPAPEAGINTSGILEAVEPYLDVSAERIKYSETIYTFDQNARDFITDYVLQDGRTATFSDGSDVVIYDSRLAYAQDIQFVTWSMEDGSTISLIGTFAYPHLG